MIRIDLPQNVNFIIDTLYEHGFEAYAVGGCVRDSDVIACFDKYDMVMAFTGIRLLHH